MRNLKRALSLVLAAGMIVGMMIVGTSAAFKDNATIDHTEAVEVLTALGVVGGDTSGNYNPTAQLTRGAFCVMMANLLNGGNFDATLYNGVATPFKDIKGHYAEAYIKYCYGAGIINGTSATTFNPSGALTGTSSTAILLSALGYNGGIEFVDNGNFSTLLVAKVANSAGLYSGVSVSAGATVTRDTAAQFILNTLKATMVEYNGSAINVTSGTSTVTVSNSKATKVDNTTTNDYHTVTADKDLFMQFCEQYFTKLKMSSADDKFGAPGNRWNYKTEIGKYASEADYTYTAAAAGSTYSAKIKDMGIKDFTMSGGSVTPVINGKAGTAVTNVNGVVDLTGNGTIVKLYVDKDNIKVITDIVVIKTELAEVSSVTATKVTLTSKTASVNGSYTIKDDEDCFAAASKFAAKDYVLVVPVYDSGSTYNVTSIVAAESVTGNITAFQKESGTSNNKNITVDGTVYTVAAVAGDDVKLAAVNHTTTATVWLDTYGNAIFAKATAAATKDFLYVAKVYLGQGSNSELVNKVRGVLTDGTAVDVEYDGITANANTLYAILDTDNDVYTLKPFGTGTTPVASIAANDQADVKEVVALTNGGSIKSSDKGLTLASTDDGTANHFYYGNYYASDVAFIYTNTTTKTVTVKTGVQAVSSIPTGSVAIVEKNSATDATAVVTAVILVDGIATTVSTDTMLYVNSGTATGAVSKANSVTGKSDTIPTYTAYLNGDKITVDTSKSPLTQGFYTYATSESNGSYVLAPYTSAGTDGTAVKTDKAIDVTFDKRLITVDGVVMDISSAKIVDLRSPNAQATDSITLTAAGVCEAKATYGTLNVSALYAGKTGVVDVLYIVSNAAGYAVTAPTSVVAAAPKGAYSATVSATTALSGTTITVTITMNTAPTAGTDTVKLTGVTGGTAATGVTFASTDTVGATKTITYVTTAADSQAVISVTNA